MSDSFARRTSLVAAGQTAVKTTQLVLAVLLVRLLSPDEWNQAAYLLSIYLVATMLGSLNIHQGILFFLPRVGPHRQRALVVQNLLVLLGLGAAIGVGLTLAAPLLAGGRLGDSSRLPLVGLAVALELPVACIETTMIATRRFVWSAVWDIAGTALVIVATVLPVTFGAGVDGVVRGLVVAAALRLIGAVVVLGRLVSGPLFGLGGKLLASQLAFAVPLGATLGVSILNRAVDKWLIAAFHSGDFGIYAVAAQEIPLLAVLPYAGGAALVAALVDAFHRGDVHLARTHWIHLTMTMSTFVVPMSMALVLIAPEVIVGVFTAEFSRGVLPFQLFTLVTMHRVAEYGMLLRAAGRARDLLGVALFTLVANTVLAGLGAWLAGMTGASLGTLVASGLGWAVALHRIADVLEVPVRMAFAWRAWLSSVAIACWGAALAWLVVRCGTELAGMGTASRISLKLVVFAAAYVGGVWAWRRSPRSRPPESVVLPVCLTPSRGIALPSPEPTWNRWVRDVVTTRLRFFAAQGLAQVADAIATIVIADVVLGGRDGVEPADLLSTLGAATLPYLVAGPVSGVVADRWDRRRTLLVVHLARAALTVLAAAAVAADGRLAGLIAVFGLLTGARFAYTLRAAALPHLAGPPSWEHARLVALDALALRVAAVAIAAGGGLAAATGGDAPIVLLLLAAALHVAAGLVFVSLGCDLGGRSAALTHAGTSLAEVVARLGRVLTGPGSRLAISVTSTHRFLLGATFATFVLIAANDFGFGPRGYVVASAVTGCGSMLGTLTAPRCSGALGMPRLVGIAFGAPAGLLLATGLVRAEAFLAVAVGASFFVFQNLRVVADATVQASIADHARARVFSVYDALYNLSYFAGAAAALAFSDASRPELLVWIAAGYLVLAVALAPRVGGRMSTPTQPADARQVCELPVVRGAA